jgi:hypothetical protein
MLNSRKQDTTPHKRVTGAQMAAGLLKNQREAQASFWFLLCHTIDGKLFRIAQFSFRFQLLRSFPKSLHKCGNFFLIVDPDGCGVIRVMHSYKFLHLKPLPNFK